MMAWCLGVRAAGIELIERSKELKLRRVSTELRAREDVSVLVAVQATKLLHRVPHPILL